MVLLFTAILALSIVLYYLSNTVFHSIAGTEDMREEGGTLKLQVYSNNDKTMYISIDGGASWADSIIPEFYLRIIVDNLTS